MVKHWWTRVVVGRTSVSDPLQEHEPPDARFEAEWRPNVKSRLLVILGLLGMWVVGVEARLVYLQVYAHESFVVKARRQQLDEITVEASRGDVLDRNGQLLAYSVQSIEVFANPSLVKHPERPAGLARDVCAAFGDCSSDERTQITAKLSRSAKQVSIRGARQMSVNAAIGLRALIERRAKAKLPPALIVVSRNQRYYPQLDLAAHVVGFVYADGQGGGGVESRYDKDIRGIPGRVLAQVDGQNDEMFRRVEREPVPGAALELTIDVGLQNIAEHALRAGITSSGASGGTAIILSVDTGEILAQASFPTYNPNMSGSFSDDARRNRAVQDTYEPGSTFKIVTASAAINEGIVRPADLIDCSAGFIKFPGRKPITENEGHNYGVLSFEDVLIRSSNVGAIKAGLQVGGTRMLDYVAAFGFGQKVAPDFAGEAAGGVGGAATFDESSLASVSMGYQVNVTPIQMAAAANVVASGGLLIEPHVVRARVRDGRREEVAPRVLRRVIAPETALAMTTIMEGVVSDAHGTARAAALERYQVAGKTGTSKKVVDGRYSTTDYNVSFVGFVPSRRPVFTILVMVDTPRIGPKYGGTVAAPIFKRIAESALQYAGVAPSINPAPPIIVPAERRVFPPQPTRASVVVPSLETAGGRPVMPDLRGLTLRDAIRVANALALPMSTDGDGVVVFQTPAPGSVINSSDRGTLQLRRNPVKAGGGGR